VVDCLPYGSDLIHVFSLCLWRISYEAMLINLPTFGRLLLFATGAAIGNDIEDIGGIDVMFR